MAVFETGTNQGGTAVQDLETGTLQAASYVELETGTTQGGSYFFELETGNIQAATSITEHVLNTFVVPNSEAWQTAVAGAANNLVLPIYEVFFTLVVDGVSTDLTPYMLSFSFERMLGGKSTFNVRFTQHSPAGFDSDGYPLPDIFSHMQVKQQDFNPLFLGRNGLADKILSHRFDRSRHALITIRMTLEDGTQQSWGLPTMLMGTPRLDGATGVLDWGGEDIIALLEKEGPYGTDIVPGDNAIAYAHATIREICTSRGITSVDIRFPDYPIRLLRRSSGTARKWIEEICEPYQAHMYVDGDVLVLEPAKPLDTGNSQWAWVDYLNISQLTVEQLEGWKNKFILNRQQDQSGVLSGEDGGPQICRGPQCVGTQTVSLAEPVNSCVLLVKAINSSTLRFYDYRPKDEFGNYLAPAVTGSPNGVSFSSPYKIYAIEFISEPYFFGAAGGSSDPNAFSGLNVNDPDALAQYIPEYEWIIFGGNEPAAVDGPDPVDAYDQPFTFTRLDTATNTIWGEIPEGENIEIEVIPNGTVGAAAADALLYENIRQIFQCTFMTPYVNPAILPNSIHAITHHRTSQGNVKWLMESISLEYSEQKTLTQSFNLKRGLIV